MDFNTFFKFRYAGIVVLSLVLCGMAAAPPLVGGPAPPFQLKAVNGATVKFSDLKGKFVVLNFWATWCVPCTKEMPELQKAHQSLKNDINVVGINFAESEEKVSHFVHEHHLSFPVLLDGRGNTSQDYEILNLPVTYIITPDGIVREKIFGGGITQKMIEAKINRWSRLSDSAQRPRKDRHN